MKDNREEIRESFEEMLIANSSKQDVLKIKDLMQEYDKGFRLAKRNEFDKAKIVFREADAALYSQFGEDSFEYYLSQLFAIPSKSYLEFKMKKKNQAILLTKKCLEYAILLQDYPSCPDLIGLFISQMLDNLAKIHLVSKEIKDWHEVTLENIHLLLNFSMPRNCEGFDMLRFKKAPIHLRYFTLISVINETLINIIKFKVTSGQELIASILINNTSDDILSLVDDWRKLNVYINRQQTNTDVFRKAYQSFLEAKHSEYDLRKLKMFLNIRIKEEGIQLYEVA